MATIQELLTTVGDKVGVIAKNLDNAESRYKARGIDDVLAAFHQPLIDAGVVVLPKHRFLEGHWGQGTDRSGNARFTRTVTLETTITFVGPEGDDLSITAIGEASDTSDKAANQAMQAGFKYAMLQAFVVPTGEVDADSKTIDHRPPTRQAAPTTKSVPSAQAPLASRVAAATRPTESPQERPDTGDFWPTFEEPGDELGPVAGGNWASKPMYGKAWGVACGTRGNSLGWDYDRLLQEIEIMFGEGYVTHKQLNWDQTKQLIDSLIQRLEGDSSGSDEPPPEEPPGFGYDDQPF